MAEGSLAIVGIGPGDYSLLTRRAEEVLRSASLVVGYEAYVELMHTWLPEQRYLASPITQETERARTAVERALDGERVALIGSGDAGIYGLAGLALQLLAERDAAELPVEVVPGVTAATSVAALLGAPLGHDFAVISLSDLLTPWETIRRRLLAAAEADFVTVLYNPASRRRRHQLEETRQIFLLARPSQTPVGLVTQAYRAGQQVSISTLEAFDPSEAGMLSTVVIGNSTTFRWRNRLITPRGYRWLPESPSSDAHDAPVAEVRRHPELER
jgi:precorrin-3B C17-methyltransferase